MNFSNGAVRCVAVIGLDGTPHSFIEKEMAAGNLPHLKQLTERGRFVPLASEIPTISSVAWASFMTGRNPGEHGIFGFTDRQPGTYDLYFPNYAHLKAEPFWDRLSREGKRCCVLNVPSTYPARALNGVLVSGFVAPSLERATYPAEALDWLKRSGYRIDVDASKGRQSLELLFEDLHVTLEKRREAMLHFWRQEQWDFFMCVFTGTDRLHHFVWRQYDEGDPVYHPEFLRYYRRLDEIVGEFVDLLPSEVRLMMLSDHGFCSLKRQVYINHLLHREGLLAFRSEEPKTIADIDPAGTRAYCMDPGRLYVNLAGREPGGIVAAGEEYEQLLVRLTEMMTGLVDPDDGSTIVEAVSRGTDLYSGESTGRGPDLVVVPHRGYDFKGAVSSQALTDIGPFTGMHTHDDAMLYLPDELQAPTQPSVRDVAGLIQELSRS